VQPSLSSGAEDEAAFEVAHEAAPKEERGDLGAAKHIIGDSGQLTKRQALCVPPKMQHQIAEVRIPAPLQMLDS
jgi:hypothetical protein